MQNASLLLIRSAVNIGKKIESIPNDFFFYNFPIISKPPVEGMQSLMKDEKWYPGKRVRLWLGTPFSKSYVKYSGFELQAMTNGGHLVNIDNMILFCL